MMNPRESIEYHKRKFKYSLASGNADAIFTFDLQKPQNEFAFSDRYSQCLIKINHAYLSNRADAVNHGLDALFIDAAGGGQACASGVLLMTDIRTTNSNAISQNIGAQIGDGMLQEVRSGIHCILHNKRGSAGVAGQFLGVNLDAASEVVVGKAAGGAGGAGGNATGHRVMMWEYIDDRPIEDAGVLCANPFGKTMEIRLFSMGDGTQVKLTSSNNINVAASNGSSLNIELEILMLPNPTPEDK